MDTFTNDKLPNENCYNAVNCVANSSGYLNCDLTIECITKKGENFMGNIFRVVIKEYEKSLNLILKCAPNDDSIRKELPVINAYNSEIGAYKEVFEMFNEIQNRNTITPDLKLNFVKFYIGSNKTNEEVIILEDLKVLEYEILDKKKPVTFEHAALVVTSLGKLHALSFYTKKNDPGQFEEITSKYKDYFVENESLMRFVYNSIELAVKEIIDPLMKEKLVELRKTCVNDLKLALKPDDFSVICQGDTHINNVMFKYQDGKPIDVRLIDFQLLRFAPPSTDLVSFLMSSTDGEFREQHYQACIDLYYDTITKVMREYKLDVEAMFPRHIFDEQVTRAGKYGAIFGVCASKVLVAEDDEAMGSDDLVSYDQYAAPKKSYNNYLKKLTDVVSDCVNYGYL